MMVIASAILAWAFALIAAIAVVRSVSSAEERARTSWWWRPLVFGAVLALRWPALIAPYDFNPDESQSVAGALTLVHDPRFWISVDGATAGPLHFFAEVPCTLLPTSAIYCTERILAITLVLLVVFEVGWLLRTMYARWIAEAIELTVVIAFGLSRVADFQYLSTELVGLAIFTSALVWAMAARKDGLRDGALLAIGFLLGATPFAKLQFGPLALALGVYLAGWQLRCRRPFVPLLIGATLPTLAVAAYLTDARAWNGALIPYFYSNVEYVGAVSMRFAAVLGAFARDFWHDGPTGTWIVAGAGAVAVAVLSGAAGFAARRQSTWVAVVGFAIALVCALIPRRPYLHYTYLVLPFGLLLVGAALGCLDDRFRLGRSRRAGVIVGVLIAMWCVPGLAVGVVDLSLSLPHRPYAAVWHRENENIARVIRRYAQPGDTMAIWGIRSDLFVQAKLPQAVPQAHSELQIWPNEWQRYYLRVYAEAFARNAPAVFVDAVGERNFLFQDRAEAHEAFPILRRLVASGYTLVAELYGTRIYVRNDRAARVFTGTVERAPWLPARNLTQSP